jgi:hypothetical protein
MCMQRWGLQVWIAPPLALDQKETKARERKRNVKSERHACMFLRWGRRTPPERAHRKACICIIRVRNSSIHSLSLSTLLIDAALVPLQSFSLSNSKQASDPSASVVLRLRRTLF